MMCGEVGGVMGMEVGEARKKVSSGSDGKYGK